MGERSETKLVSGYLTSLLSKGLGPHKDMCKKNRKKEEEDVPKEYPTMHSLKPTTHKAKAVTSDNVNKLGDSFLSKGTCVINSKKKKGK